METHSLVVQFCSTLAESHDGVARSSAGPTLDPRDFASWSLQLAAGKDEEEGPFTSDLPGHAAEASDSDGDGEENACVVADDDALQASLGLRGSGGSGHDTPEGANPHHTARRVSSAHSHNSSSLRLLESELRRLSGSGGSGLQLLASPIGPGGLGGGSASSPLFSDDSRDFWSADEGGDSSVDDDELVRGGLRRRARSLRSKVGRGSARKPLV